MELAFLVSAVKRYLWIIVLFGVVGALPGIWSELNHDERYESRAVVLIAPPTDSRSLVTVQGDPDRYVAGEISVFESLSEQVAERAGLPEGTDLGESVAFEQQPLSDVVLLSVRADGPELARDIAQAYLDIYFEVQREQVTGSNDPAIADIDAEIEQVQADLAAVDAELNELLAPYVSRDVIPTPEQLAPALSSERSILITRYNELQQARSELSSGLRLTSRVVRDATLPTAPLGNSGLRLALIGGVAGGFLGMVVAVVLARFSRTVIDDEQAEELLGHEIHATLPVRDDAPPDGLPPFFELPAPYAEFLDTLAVRVEAVAPETGAITVLTTATTPGTGTSTLAASLASREASEGLSVLLVDANTRNDDLTVAFTPTGSHAEILATGIRNLSFTTLADLVTFGGGSKSRHAGRPDIGAAIAAVSGNFDIIVFDGGTLMHAASTIHLARTCDVVLLTMPERQHLRPLQSVGHELAQRNNVLPMWSSVARKPSRLPRGTRGAAQRSDRRRGDRPDDDPGSGAVESAEPFEHAERPTGRVSR